MRSLTFTCVFLFVAGVFLFLGQMWFNLLSPDLFIKISITDAALFLIILVIDFLIKENNQTQKINEAKNLDE